MSATTRLVTTLVSVVLLASALHAVQFSSSLSGPVLGYVLDRNAAKLRPVRGIIGSATVGAPLDSGYGVTQVLSLDGGHLIASTDATAELMALTVDAGQVSSVVVPGVVANPTRSAASVQGKSAAFYYSGTHDVRIVAGLPEEPRHVATWQTDRPLTQMAVNDDGTLLVYAVAEADGEALYALSASSASPRFLTSAVSVSGLAITKNGDAIVTDRSANEVFAIWDATGGAVRKLLADANDGVSSPAGVAVSSAGRIYVASTGSVMVLDPNGRVLKSQRCNCTVSGVNLLRDSVFRLTDGITQTIFLLDASSSEERILFVPPPQD
jgi:hypothetical protein